MKEYFIVNFGQKPVHEDRSITRLDLKYWCETWKVKYIK